MGLLRCLAVFRNRVIAFDAVVAPLPVDVPDAVKMWITVMVDFAFDAAIGLHFRITIVAGR